MPRLPHRTLRGPLREPDLARGLPRRDRPGDHVPRGPHAADRARSRAAHGRGLGGAGVRGGRPSPQPSHLLAHPRAASAGRLRAARPTTSSRSRSTTASPTSSSSRFARAGSTSGARSTSRTSAMGTSRRADRLVPRRVLRPAGRRPAARRRARASSRIGRCSRTTSRSVAARGSRCASRRGARSGGCSRSPSATPSSRCATRRSPPHARAHGARRRSRSCARRSTSRRCRCASSASTPRTWASRSASRRWSCSRRRCRAARTTAQFGIRHEGGQDDFRSIAEAVRRRFARYRLVEEEGYDRSFATLPNLVVIDGGKGQLAAALAAMREFDLPRVAVVSLAKREEEVFVPGRAASVRLERDSPGLLLLQRIRDEAHRFAITFHRTPPRAQPDDVAARRSPRRRRAPPRRAAAPFRRGGRGCSNASREELEAVPGLPAEGRARSLRSPAPHRTFAADLGGGSAACRDLLGRRVGRGRARPRRRPTRLARASPAHATPGARPHRGSLRARSGSARLPRAAARADPPVLPR